MPSPAASPPDHDALLAAAGTTLTATRKKAKAASKRAATTQRGPLPVSRAPAPASTRRPAGLLSVSEASDDASAAATLREWLASMAGAPKGSRWAKHRTAVVRKALALLEARRTDAQEAELRALLSSLAL